MVGHADIRHTTSSGEHPACIVFKLFVRLLCVCVSACVRAYAKVYLWELEDNLWEFIFSFHWVKPKDPTQGHCAPAWHRELLPIEPSFPPPPPSPPLHYFAQGIVTICL